MTEHQSGVSVLCAPIDVQDADIISAGDMVEILCMLQTLFDYVIVDTPPYLEDIGLPVLEHSDLALMVVDPEAPRIHAQLHLDTLRLVKYPMSQVRLVLNCRHTQELNPGEIERSLGLEISAVIPSEGAYTSLADRVARRHARGFETLCLVVGADIGSGAN